MKWRNVAVVLAAAGVIAVWVLCLIPLAPGSGFEYKDKIEHLTAYLLQTLSLILLFPRHRGRIVVWFLLQGAAIEGLQSLTSYRDAELADMAANTLGILLGLALSFTPLAARAAQWLAGTTRRRA